MTDAPADDRRTPLVDQPDDCEDGHSTGDGENVTPISVTAFCGFLFPAFAGLLFGYDIGSTSGAVLSLEGSVPGGSNSPLLSSVLHSASLMGAVVGTLGTFLVATPLGRRREIMLGAVFYILGTALTVLGLGGTDARVACVIAGRIVYGFGIALSMHAAPVYISEVTPSRVRGLFVSLKEGFIVLGIMLGFTASAVFTSSNAWRWIWVMPLPIGVAVFTGMFVLPPSPRWLLQRAHRAAAKLAESSGNPFVGAPDTSRALAALFRFRSRSPREDVESEVESILTLLRDEGGARSYALLDFSEEPLSLIETVPILAQPHHCFADATRARALCHPRLPRISSL